MKTYRIRPLALTSVENDMSVFTYRFHYGRKIHTPHYIWYIEGADKHILVDTAASAEMARSLRGFEAQDLTSFEDALGSLKLRPPDIDIVIQTHLQWDHCANTSKCKNAKVIATETELLFALAPHPILAPTYRRELLKNLNFTLVKGPHEVIPGIELIPAPGHTPGTQAVSIQTEKGRAVLTGFCCIRENFEPPEAVREILPVIAPGIHLNAVEAFETALRIKSMADILIPMHDPSFAGMKTIP
jgi:glyoxylase-like metal-dependent hydrolase (beta-lactamase superfamily II)